VDNKFIRYSIIVGLVVIVLIVSFGVVKQPSEQANTNTTFNLQAPHFVGVARAEEDSIASFMEDEAGISSYFKASTGIALNDVRDAFRTIEVETTNYIIGSVPVTNYPESEDVHVYVHTDGWVVAYYLTADPVSKIFDSHNYHDTSRTAITTKLDNTLIHIASEAFVTYPGCTYYDFRFPNATNLMLVTEWTDTTDSFEVNLPSSFVFFERSWSLATAWWRGGTYQLNGVDIHKNSNEGWTSYGVLTVSQLPQNQNNTIQIVSGLSQGDTYGGLGLVYKEP